MCRMSETVSVLVAFSRPFRILSPARAVAVLSWPGRVGCAPRKGIERQPSAERDELNRVQHKTILTDLQ